MVAPLLGVKTSLRTSSLSTLMFLQPWGTPPRKFQSLSLPSALLSCRHHQTLIFPPWSYWGQRILILKVESRNCHRVRVLSGEIIAILEILISESSTGTWGKTRYYRLLWPSYLWSRGFKRHGTGNGMLAMLDLSSIAVHVPSLAVGKVPHHRSAEPETWLSPTRTPRTLMERSTNEQMDPSDVLKKSGTVVLGNIDPKVVENVRTHCKSPNTKRSRYQRQTELEWNDDCDAVFEYFETVGRRELAQ